MTADPGAGTGTLSYLYAVCRADAPDPPFGPAAAPAPAGAAAAPAPAGGTGLRLVRHSGLAAVVGSVPAEEFGTEGLEARLNDLERLEALARAHNAVVDAVHSRTTVLPMRLATVYLDDTRVAGVLRCDADRFGRLLDWLDGHEELGVKVYAAPVAPERPAATGAASQPPQTGAGADAPGRAYLRRRQAQRRGHREAYRAAGEVAARLPQTVSGLARARVAHRPQQAGLGPRPGENIANEAYLVARSDRAAFRAAVSSLAQGVPGVRVEVTGPWAPYSFTAHVGTKEAEGR